MIIFLRSRFVSWSILCVEFSAGVYPLFPAEAASMNGFNPLRRFLGVEQLDDRTVPSAVDVFVSQNTWVVRGDNANNSIAVTQLNATTARITGVAPEGGGTTTVNGRGFVDVSTARAIRFEMRDGNDRIDLRGSSQLKVRFPSVGIDLGGGVDTLLVNHLSTPGGFDVFTGGETRAIGYENVAVTQSDFGSFAYRSDRSAGSNSLGFNSSSVQADVTIQGSFGSNSATLSSLRVGGSIRANMGSTPANTNTQDSFQLTASTVGNLVRVDQGGGRGVVSIGSTTAARAEVSLGGDYDQLLLNNNTFTSGAFDGGVGTNDRISGSGNRIRTAPVIRNFDANTVTFIPI